MNISDSRFMVETPFVGCDHSFYTLFAVSIRSWAGYAPPAAWHRLEASNLPLPVLETGALPAELRRHEKKHWANFAQCLKNGQQKTTVRVHRGSVLFEGIHVQVCFRVSVHLL